MCSTLTYLALLGEEGIIDETESNEATGEEKQSAQITVEQIRLAVVGGESVVYINGSDGNLYKQTLAADEGLMLVQVGDVLKLSYYDTDIARIYQIESWSFFSDVTKQ